MHDPLPTPTLRQPDVFSWLILAGRDWTNTFYALAFLTLVMSSALLDSYGIISRGVFIRFGPYVSFGSAILAAILWFLWPKKVD